MVSLAVLGATNTAFLDGALSLRLMVSGPSVTASGTIATANDLVVSPAANDRTPEVAVKSSPAVAVPAAAAYRTEAGIRASPPRVTVMVAVGWFSSTE